MALEYTPSITRKRVEYQSEVTRDTEVHYIH